jgi:signal transduction histidine kinase
VKLTGLLTMARPGVRPPRRTVRLRLTLLYSVLFLAAGAGLLTITYLLVRSTNDGDPALPSPPSGPGLKAVELREQALAIRASDLHHLLTMSGIALAIMVILAVWLGWLVAGHVLRPLRTITTATQRISEQNLHERLALPGPSDEIKDLADTIDGLLQRLEVAFDGQRRFVANASHELRTPLTLNRALLDVALADPSATVEDLRAMGQDLIASGEQQQQLIEALLTLASSASGLECREPLDLAEIVAELLSESHPKIEQLGLAVQITIAPAPAVGDPRLAKRLVANLIDNSLRHNFAAGEVALATRTESGHAVLTVTNSGPIIPEADIDRLFQPFQRLHSNRTYHTDGHGLGLSIVQAIAAAHGATLSARAQPDGGLHIEVRFPPAPKTDRALIQRGDTNTLIRSG